MLSDTRLSEFACFCCFCQRLGDLRVLLTGSGKPQYKCLLRPAPASNTVPCVRIATRTKEKAVLEALDR